MSAVPLVAVPKSSVSSAVGALPWLLPALVLAANAALAQPAATRATAAGVLATGAAILPALALGHFGALAPRPFLAVQALLVATAGLLGGPPGRSPTAAPRAAPRGVPAERHRAWLRAVPAIAFALAVLAGLAALHGERHQPPDKLDDPSYHLTTVALWHHHGDLRTPKFGYGDPSTAFYPLGGTVVAYAGFNQPYPFHGARLEHRVEQVPTRGPAEARHSSWQGDASIPWRTGRYRAWRRNLRRLGVEYVVTVAAAEPERRWIDRHPQHFELVATAGEAALWRFRADGPAPGRPGR